MSNKSIIVIGAVAIAGVTAVCGILTLATRRKRVKPVPVAVVKSPTPNPVHQATSTERETVKVVAVTKEPTSAFDDVYRMTQAIAAIKLLGNHPIFVNAALVYTDLNEGNLPIDQFWMEACMNPETLISDSRNKEITQIFIDTHSGIFLIVDGDDYFSTYLDNTREDGPRFILSGPCFENVSTAGWLELVLEKYMQTWGL